MCNVISSRLFLLNLNFLNIGRTRTPVFPPRLLGNRVQIYAPGRITRHNYSHGATSHGAKLHLIIAESTGSTRNGARTIFDAFVEKMKSLNYLNKAAAPPLVSPPTRRIRTLGRRGSGSRRFVVKQEANRWFLRGLSSPLALPHHPRQ